MMPQPARIELTVPARQDMMIVVRMALSGVCALGGVDAALLDDIRTAADEAFYCLLHQPQAVHTIRMRCQRDAQRLLVSMDALREAAGTMGTAAHDPEVARGILCMLVTDVALRHDAGGVYGIELDIRIGTL